LSTRYYKPFTINPKSDKIKKYQTDAGVIQMVGHYEKSDKNSKVKKKQELFPIGGSEKYERID